MFCTNCGSQFEDGNSFCPNCGTKVESVAQPVAAAAPVAAPVEAAPVQAAPVEAAPVQAVPVAAAAAVATPVQPAPAPAPAPAPVATPVQPVAPVAPVQPVYTQATPVAPAGGIGANDGLGKQVLVFGIIAVACCIFYFFSIAAIICGAIGLSKAKKFLEECGQLYGVAKVGKYLSLGGLIGGCVITGIVAFYIIIYVLAAVATAMN